VLWVSIPISSMVRMSVNGDIYPHMLWPLLAKDVDVVISLAISLVTFLSSYNFACIWGQKCFTGLFLSIR
jgi:hypothetical protein